MDRVGRAQAHISSTRIALETVGAAALAATVAVALSLLAIHFGAKLDLKTIGATVGLAAGAGGVIYGIYRVASNPMSERDQKRLEDRQKVRENWARQVYYEEQNAIQWQELYGPQDDEEEPAPVAPQKAGRTEFDAFVARRDLWLRGIVREFKERNPTSPDPERLASEMRDYLNSPPRDDSSTAICYQSLNEYFVNKEELIKEAQAFLAEGGKETTLSSDSSRRESPAA